MKKFTLSVLAAVTAASFVTAPASAQIFSAPNAAIHAAQAPALTEVQFRRHGYHGGYYRHGYRRHGYYGGYHRHGYGRGVGAGIAGLAAGAIIGGAIAAQAGRADNNSIAYCESRYKSYDPASGTYLGYDGVRHPCP